MRVKTEQTALESEFFFLLAIIDNVEWIEGSAWMHMFCDIRSESGALFQGYLQNDEKQQCRDELNVESRQGVEGNEEGEVEEEVYS